MSGRTGRVPPRTWRRHGETQRLVPEARARPARSWPRRFAARGAARRGECAAAGREPLAGLHWRACADCGAAAFLPPQRCAGCGSHRCRRSIRRLARCQRRGAHRGRVNCAGACGEYSAVQHGVGGPALSAYLSARVFPRCACAGARAAWLSCAPFVEKHCRGARATERGLSDAACLSRRAAC